MKASKEFDKFDKTMDQLLKVSHGQIKAKLEAEKAAKQPRRQKQARRKTKDVE